MIHAVLSIDAVCTVLVFALLNSYVSMDDLGSFRL